MPWPSPTVAWSRLLTERSRFVGAIPPTTTNRNCCLYLSMSSCAASCCICSPQGFVRIRNFGFLANRRRATTLSLCFQLRYPLRFERCLALPQMWWAADAGYRKAYSCGDPTPFSAKSGRDRRMRRLPTSQNLCVLPLANSLCVFLSDQSLFPTPQGHPHRTTLALSATLLLSRLGLCFPASLRGERQTYFPSIEFAYHPRPPQPRAASFKSLYRKRPTPCSCAHLGLLALQSSN